MTRKIVLCALVFALAPVAGRAQVTASVSVPLPVIQFRVAPRLVTVEPGVQVVPEYDEEVFFVGGAYYTRMDGRWYRARDYRGGWRPCEKRYVPARIVRYEPGRYRGYRVVESRPVMAVPRPGYSQPVVHERVIRERVVVREEHDRDHHDHGRHRGHDDDHHRHGGHGNHHHDDD
jgi:hypothetical protein